MNNEYLGVTLGLLGRLGGWLELIDGPHDEGLDEALTDFIQKFLNDQLSRHLGHPFIYFWQGVGRCVCPHHPGDPGQGGAHPDPVYLQ